MGNSKKSLFPPNFVFAAIVVCICSALVLAIVIPNTIRPQSGVNPIGVCRNNLRQIDAAAKQFELEMNLKAGDKINFPNDLTPYIKLDQKGQPPRCPEGGTYIIRQIGENPVCSFHGDLLGSDSR